MIFFLGVNAPPKFELYARRTVPRSNQGKERFDRKLNGWNDILVQFDLVVPDGAYITSARLELLTAKTIGDNFEKEFGIFAIATDILDGGKMFDIDYGFKVPTNYMKDLKADSSFKWQGYKVTVNQNEPLIFDVIQIIPFVLNEGPLFDGTVSFVVSFRTNVFFHYDLNPVLTLTLQKRGNFHL